MRRQRRSFLRASGIVLTGAVAGCLGGGDGGSGDGDGGSGGGGSSPTASSSPTPTATATATPGAQSAQATYPDYQWQQLDGVAPVATSAIEMRGFEFHPLVAAVGPGTEVSVSNGDGAAHTLTAPKLGIDASVSGGGETAFTVDRTGTFDYVCEFHPPGMLGRLVVTEETPTPAGTGTEPTTPTATEGGGFY